MKSKFLLILNSFSLACTLLVNYLASSGKLSENTVGDISNRYESLITPAGYAFSIWGLIYLMLICFVAYQWYAHAKGRHSESLTPSGLWFTLSNLFNLLWIIVWVNDMIGLSVIMILLLLLSLTMLVQKSRLELWDAPKQIIAFVWWPICIYFGWVLIASVTNITVFFVSWGWQGGGISPMVWSIVVIMFATILYFLLIFFRNMREAALVGAWALLAIAVAQWHNEQFVAIVALLGAAVLVIYASFHAFLNRHTFPFKL